MEGKMRIAVTGYSSFTWELVDQLRGQVGGQLYYVLPNRDLAMEAGLLDGVVAIGGDMTDTEVLDQLDLGHCHTFIAGSREEEANVLAALYAKNNGAQHVYARVFETKFMSLLEAVGVIPIQTSLTAAASTAIEVLKPKVAELVSLTRGQFDIEEVRVAEYPDLVGCRLGHLQGEYLHCIAVVRDGDISLAYDTEVTSGATLIVVYNRQIKRRLSQAIHRLASQAARRHKDGGGGF